MATLLILYILIFCVTDLLIQVLHAGLDLELITTGTWMLTVCP